MLLVMVPVGAMAGFLIASVITYVMPKKYESSATIEIKPRERTIEPSGGVSHSIRPTMTPQFFGTEFEKIKSRNTLLKVVDSLDLISRWGMDRETIVQVLKNIIVVENIRGTDLISIKVRHTNKEDARDIAAEVARAYREYRTELEGGRVEKGINDLKRAFREQGDKVEERRKALGAISPAAGLLERLKSAPGAHGVVTDGGDLAIEMRSKLEAAKTKLEAQIRGLLKYENDQLLIFAAGPDVPDNIVRQVYPEYLGLKREIEMLRANGAADDDPSFVPKAKRLELMKSNLDEGVTSLRDRLKGQLEMANDLLVETPTDEPESKKEALESNIDMQDYIDAKRDLETDLALLEQLKLKLITVEIGQELPNETIVVHEDPVISDAPISPNVTLNLLIGLIGGALISPFFALPVMWMMNRRSAV
jgi:succinoglycan biosynthesis transport protein ExoP